LTFGRSRSRTAARRWNYQDGYTTTVACVHDAATGPAYRCPNKHDRDAEEATMKTKTHTQAGNAKVGH
jgi:hypothetical protein